MDLALFVGTPLDKSLQMQLKRCKKELVTLFTTGDVYLQKIQHEGKTYLGKKVDNTLSTEELKDLSCNIESLLKRICPTITITADKLVLLSHEQ